MEHHNKLTENKPLGSPDITEEEAPQNQQKKPRKTWATMPLWKKIVVIWFLIVCAFGVYDTLFPSEKSLKYEDLLPVFATPTPTMSPTPLVTPTSIISPSPIR